MIQWMDIEYIIMKMEKYIKEDLKMELEEEYGTYYYENGKKNIMDNIKID